MIEPTPAATTSTLRLTAAVALMLVVGSLQFSIFVAQLLLGVTMALWVLVLSSEKRRPSAPRFAGPLALYAGATLLSAAFSSDPRTSLVDCKQLVLLLIVPITYELMTRPLVWPAATIVMGAGAVSGLLGIAQYAILDYNNLGLRPRGTLGMYMTFSGLTMLVVGLALSQVLFARKGRAWPTLIVPTLAVALAVTLTRSAWVGAFAGLTTLLLLKDVRLLAALPVVAAVFLLTAPPGVVQRFYSIFDPSDPTSRDRVAMLHAGGQIVQAHPLVGVGPDMIERVYPAYRVDGAVLETPPHLHSVPMQIAAERGLPALALWLWFIGLLSYDLWHLFRAKGGESWVPAAGLAASVAMLAAGLFEYNFGDSEFQMLFLFLVTLPFAAEQRP